MEEPLPAGGSCLLGSLNLSEFVYNPFEENGYFLKNQFAIAVKQVVVGMNEVLHEGLSLHPLQEQRDSVNDWRQIGIGCFGWHDCLIKLGIKYGSNESILLASEIGNILKNNALQASAQLVDVYGVYPKFNKEAVLDSWYIKNSQTETLEMIKKYGLANSQVLTIPPTGSIATMLGVSTALEPIYNISYTRKTESLHGQDEYYEVFTPIVDQYMKYNNINDKTKLPDIFVTAMTLSWEDRIKMQGEWQKFIDASISSTVNLPESATIQDVADLYIMAWKYGLKGITVFRDNCKRVGILTNSIKAETTTEIEKFEPVKQEEFPRGCIIKVPDDLIYRKYKLKTGCGYLYLFVGVDDDGKIYDCFTNTDGVAGCTVNTQAVSRLISLAIRGGVSMDKLIQQLEKAGTCPSYSFHKGKGECLAKGKSCASAIANVLKDIVKEFDDGQQEEIEEEIKEVTKIEKKVDEVKYPCLECGAELHNEGGCTSCMSCGWSKCG